MRYGPKSIKKTVLAAYGITLFGVRELVDFRIVKAESKDAWESFLNNLYTRGLLGQHLKLIVTDGGGAPRAKARGTKFFPPVGRNPARRPFIHGLKSVAFWLQGKKRSINSKN